MAYKDLDVWMNGKRVGVWFWTRAGSSSFRYDPVWTASPDARVLSLSLPFSASNQDLTGPEVEHYFDNLLPDSESIRERLRRRFGSVSTRAADLLASIGRECVGAVQLLPADSPAPSVQTLESEPISDVQIERLLANTQTNVLSGATAGASRARGNRNAIDDFRISIAGAQEKTALLQMHTPRGKRWHVPIGATPTTHIFKLPLGLVGNMRADMSDSVANEWLCMTLLAHLGLDTANTEVAQFGEQQVLVVERFDRRWASDRSWIARLPQEDFCQATGTPGALKYEAEGGPGIKPCLALLGASHNAKADRLRFALAQLAFWLLAATDGHAKNFSIFLERGGGYRMTPLYDVMSAWPIMGAGRGQMHYKNAKLAMALKSKSTHYHLHEIQTRHFALLAKQSGVPDALEAMTALVLQVPLALGEVSQQLPTDYPMPVFDAISKGMLDQAERFMQGL